MNMTPKLRDALMRLAPGIDAAALAAEDADESKQEELADAVNGAASLLDDLKKLLDLAEAAGNADIKAAVEAMLEKAKQGEAAKAEAAELKLSAEKRDRAEICAKAEAIPSSTALPEPMGTSLPRRSRSSTWPTSFPNSTASSTSTATSWWKRIFPTSGRRIWKARPSRPCRTSR